MDISIPQDQIWMVVVGFIVAFVLSFGIGANDVANSFGTSVGSKVLTLRQACILASIFETLGAVLLGAKVSDTIRKGVISVDLYQNNTMLLMAGSVSSLTGSCVWLLAATLLKLPVSATHSIIGATVGFALVNHGGRGINWGKIALIVGSWFISPLLAGLVSIAMFFIIKYFILNKKDQLEPGLRFLPVLYSIIIIVNVFSVFYEGCEILHFDRIPLWGIFILSFGSGIICAIVVRLAVVPCQRKRIEARLCALDPDYTTDSGGSVSSASVQKCELADSTRNNDIDNNVLKQDPLALSNGESEAKLMADCEYGKITAMDCDLENSNDSIEAIPSEHQGGRSDIMDRTETAELFSFLQILTAVFGSFAHGGNDVSNAISPLITLWLIAINGDVSTEAVTPIWLLVYGGVAISLGVCILGRRVIQTMGEDLTKITPSSGFCIELGSAMTVLVASNVGVPISTTHCKVGSVVFVGRFRSRDNVDWSLFRNIIIAWIVTLPVTGAVSAATMAGLRLVVT